MFSVKRAKHREAHEHTALEGWEWQAPAHRKTTHATPVVMAVTLVALSWFAWPAGAARRWDDVAMAAPVTLSAWTHAASQTEAPVATLVELAQKEGTGGDAVVPPVKRQSPKTPSASEQTPPPVAAPSAPATGTGSAAAEPKPDKQQAAVPPREAEPGKAWPGLSGLLAPLTEWLAKANREYQGTIVKELSKPSPEQMEADARRLALEKVARDREEAAKADAARQAAAAEAKKKAEAEAQRKAADAAAAAKDAEAKKQAESAKPTETAKQAEAKNEADAAKQAAADEAKKEEARKKAEAEASRKAAADAAAREAEAKKQAEAAKAQAEAEARQQREAKLAEERKAKADEQRAERARQAAARAPTPEATAGATSTGERHRRWAVTIIPEPIARPSAEAARETSQAAPRVREASGVLLGSGRMSLGAGTLRGTAVKRWVWRAAACRFAGRKLPKRYTVARGDSLWRISEKYYDQGGKYPRIYKANRNHIAHPDLIYPCQKFRVPKR